MECITQIWNHQKKKHPSTVSAAKCAILTSKAYYTTLLLSGNLVAHLNEIDDVANARMELLIKQMVTFQGTINTPKAQSQMAWVGTMMEALNNCPPIISPLVMK